MSIQQRIAIALALLSVALGTAGGVALYWLLRADLVGEFDRTSQVTAQRLAAFVERSQGQLTFDTSGEVLPAFEPGEHPDYFQIWLPDGVTLARSASLTTGTLPLEAGTPQSPRRWNVTLPNGRPGRAAGIRFVPHEDDEFPDAKGVGAGPADVTLTVARDRAGLDLMLRQLATALVLVNVFSVTATALVGGIVVRSGLRPLGRLASHAASIDATSLAFRFPTDHMPSELAPIGQRLNDLLGRLDSSFARERRFSADVAHELRTPIAELRTLAEVALRWPDDAGTARSALQDALGVALQMESIATGLLTLARCEGGLLPVHPEAILLHTTVRDLWEPLAARADAKSLSVALAVREDATWHTDPVALRVIVGNLLTNAVEYASVAGELRVHTDGPAASPRLLISNTTNQLREEDLPHLFDRFWRKDAARTSSDHCGLGLALAQAYARALGLTLQARMSGGDTVTMVLGATALPEVLPADAGRAAVV